METHGAETKETGTIRASLMGMLCLNCRLVQRGETALTAALSALLESPGESEEQGGNGHFILGSCISDSVCQKCSEETNIYHI